MKQWRVSIDSVGIEEADTEEEAVQQFIDSLDVTDCEVELESEDAEVEEDEEEEEDEGEQFADRG